ncbi:MAG TPA: amino acid ABC transporter permease [Peptococcaceae bacterium]|nr:amino acid ABC transporter permease [Clostridia bacterium]HOB82065.1 amino acid ABC transporter permease [Peptococcaceae bacterium]HPZ71449.1 amino acid ABC transporter permease [Peptococcaceae bacterium]HQD54173.1 amino acid ABC transporter permease [Peptococcaceae bacterium]
MANFSELFVRAIPQLLTGAVTTIWITALAVSIGVLIGLVVGLARISGKTWLRALARVYVDAIRGTPLLVQIFIIYLGIPNLLNVLLGQQFPINVYVAGVMACGLNSGAYVAEIVRAGIQSIDRGQTEAARSLGMNSWQTMRYVILPQAFKRIIPPLGNEFIAMLKDTSLLSVIGIEELTRKGQLFIAVTFAPFPVYTGVLLMYLAMTLTISRFVSMLERRLAVSDRSN